MRTLELIEDETLWIPNAGGQQQFMDDYTTRYLALAGGWYSGKTYAGARKLIDLHVYNGVTESGQLTGVDSCVIAQTYQLAQTINIPEVRKALDEAGIAHRFVAENTKFWFDLPDFGTKSDPSLIYVRTADRPEVITGFTVGAIWGDEVARWKSDELNPLNDPKLQAMGRLRDPRARILQFLMTFTHEGDDTAVYRDFEESPKPNHKLYRAGTFENPHAKDYADQLVGQLTPELKAQYVDGVAAQFRGGSVYSSYTDARNKDDTLILDDRLPLHLSVDFNIAPGMHAIIGQHHTNADLLTAVYELHRQRMDVRQMIGDFFELVKKLGGWKWPELHLFGDPSGDSKWSASGDKSAWDILIESIKNYSETNRVPIIYKKKVPLSHAAVGDRVNSTNCALFTLGGKVRYKIHGGQTPEKHSHLEPGCPRLIRDYKRLKWTDGEIDKDDRKLSHPSEADSSRVHFLMPIRKPIRSTNAIVVGPTPY